MVNSLLFLRSIFIPCVPIICSFTGGKCILAMYRTARSWAFQDSRLIQAIASRPIVKEDLVSELADTFMLVVRPLGCVARATGRHGCVAARGVKCHEAQLRP